METECFDRESTGRKNRQGTFLYGPDDKVPIGKSAVYGLQFLVFYIASGAIIPVIIGASLGLDQAAIATMLQRTFLLIGVISILQFLFGHRFPIVEGPAGLWMGILILLASTTSAMGFELSTLRTDIEFGMICAGVMACVVALSGLIVKIIKLFTPIINGTFLVLMAIQMSGTVLQGGDRFILGLHNGAGTIPDRFCGDRGSYHRDQLESDRFFSSLSRCWSELHADGCWPMCSRSLLRSHPPARAFSRFRRSLHGVRPRSTGA